MACHIGRKRWLIALFAVELLAVFGCRATPLPPQPPPPRLQALSEITAATKVFVSNHGGDDAASINFPQGIPEFYNLFIADLQAWGHYKIVSSPADADIILELYATQRPKDYDPFARGVYQQWLTTTQYPIILELTVRNVHTQAKLWETGSIFNLIANSRKSVYRQRDAAVQNLSDQLKGLFGRGNTISPQ